MEMLPQIETISTLKHNQEAVLSKVKERPVLLLQHNKPLAVMVTPEQWDWTAQTFQALKKRIRDLELLLEARRVSARMDADPSSIVKLGELEKRLATHA
jgi:PHD/YefM family antitoxin component YafN of YafNO toxin-antitoxin module